MTYFGFLFRFLLLPILALGLLTWRDERRGRPLPPALRGAPWWKVLLGIVAVALIYTTPWDNYLVATGVWWYDRALVSGVVIGWVPIEEYTFFILQPIFTGLLFLWLARRWAPEETRSPDRARRGVVMALLSGAAAMLILLLAGWAPGTYLALELVWALPVVALQIAFGGDIIWRARRAVLPAIVLATAALSWADALAIGAGTWTIDPAQSLGLYLGGVLPVEELVFFLLTNILCVFGTTLVLSSASRARLDELIRAARAWRAQSI